MSLRFGPLQSGPLLLLASFLALSLASPVRASVPTPTSTIVLESREFALRVSNAGHWACPATPAGPAFEYPRASGLELAFAGGFWAAARIAGEWRVAASEYGSDFVPGPAPAGLSWRDDERFRAFRIARGDTAGRAAWSARAVPLGAPAADVGDATLWTVYTDAGPCTAELPTRTPRASAPLGLEVRLTAWTFDRPGALAGVAYLHWRCFNRGDSALDSLRLGLFLDPLGDSGSRSYTASDTTRDLFYAWRQSDDDAVYGAAGPALGVRLLRGPVVGARALRPLAVVAYPNGSDPADASQFVATLAGRMPWGASMIDSVTGDPTMFWSPGDPVTGLEWVATGPPHTHSIMAIEPFTLAAGDSAELTAAVIVARGADRFASITALRDRADDARAYWADGFSSLPPRELLPLTAGPNPAHGQVRLSWSVTGEPKRLRADVYDLTGRRVRRLLDEPFGVGDHVLVWDGRDDVGQQLPQGVYVVRVRHGVRDGSVRVALLR